MKRATEADFYPIAQPVPFEIRPEHRDHPGWQWLWERLFRPLQTEQPTAISDGAPAVAERVEEIA